MRVFVPVFALLLIPFLLQAQCVVGAGEDQKVCDYPEPFPKLNGQVLQADSIVSLKWEAQSQDEEVFFFASDMLSDTSILNPEFHSHYERSVTFFLTATDVDGDICSDTVTYYFSDWTFLAVDKAAIKDPSDTIQLYVAGFSNFPIVEYAWSPSYNISDVSVPDPQVWNDTTTTYHLQLTDSIGCTVEDDPFEVYIRTTASHSVEVTAEPIFYPNPAQSSIYIPDFTKWESILVSDSKGRVIRIVRSNSSIQLDPLPAGIYYITFFDKKGGRWTKQLSKN